MWTKAHWSVRGLRGAWWSACVLAMLCGGTAAWAATVTGTITADGQPLPGAWIHIDARAHGRLHSAQTDERGKYVIQGVATGAYELSVGAPEHSHSRKQVVIHAADQVLKLDFELRKLPTVSGRMLLASGEPLAGTQVDMVLLRDRSSNGYTVSTEADGSYRCACSRGAGSFTITARVSGYATVTVADVMVHAGADTPGVDFVFRDPAGSISGSVYAADGVTPVAGAQVRTDRLHPMEVASRAAGRDRPSPWSWLSERPGAIAAANGSFAIGDLQAGHYDIAARGPGFQATYVPDPVRVERSQNVSGVNIVLKPAGQIRGTVYGADGRPAPECTMRYEVNRPGADRERVVRDVVRTDEQGRYLIDYLPAGTYSLTLQAMQAAPATYLVTVQEGRAAEVVDHRLQAGLALAGTVSDHDGTPADGAQVYIRPTEGTTRSRRSARTDAEGRFRIEHLAPGTYEYVAAASGAPPTGYGSATVGPDSSSVLDIRLAEPAAIRGRVIASDGAPIAGADVYCELSETELSLRAWPDPYWELRQTVVTDEDGAYAIEGLIAGGWRVSARAKGYATRVAEVRVAEPGEQVQAPDLVLGRLVRLAGRVLMPDGKTPAGNRALKVRLQLGGSGEREVTTDAEGQFVIPDVPPTIQRLEFRTEGLAPVQVVVESPEVARDGLEVRLLAFGAIRGTLRRTDGELPADGVYIVAGSPGLRMSDWAPAHGSSRSLHATKLVPPERRWAIEDVPPGRWGLQVIGDGLALLDRTDITVPEGTVAQIDLQVSAGGSVAGRVTAIGGEPVAGARVRVPTEGLRIRRLEPSATTDQDGRYVLDHVTPGLRRVEVSASGFAGAELDEVTVAEGLTTENVDFELFVGGTIVGKIRTPDGTPPRREYNVHLAGGPDYGWANMRADGTFELKHILPGTYEVVLGRPKPYTAVATEPNVVVSEGETTAPIEFVVPE